MDLEYLRRNASNLEAVGDKVVDALEELSEGGGGGGISSLSDIPDVDTTHLYEDNVLKYKEDLGDGSPGWRAEGFSNTDVGLGFVPNQIPCGVGENAPTPDLGGYGYGSLYFATSTGTLYVCVDATPDNFVWTVVSVAT